MIAVFNSKQEQDDFTPRRLLLHLEMALELKRSP